MNYTVDIIDTQDNTLVTSDERAVASSIILDWKGGDQKDELFIVGSSLSFTMVGMSLDDGQYLDLFTGDETRYKVRLYDENNVTVWSGFLLPDAYSEPYSNVPILVDFEATDGLGRLKGKYLPEDFYKEEKSVIEILAACLKLTGLDLSFRFAPAIENSQQKDYNKIYLDTSYYKEKDKNQDAYKILDDLLQSMLCTLYQADNYYNIEGLNVRNFRVYKAKIYSPSGTLTDTQEITRLEKHVLGLGKPSITMQPPYGEVIVEHDREDVSLPGTLSKENNDGWVVVTTYPEEIYALDWKGNNGFYALADSPDYKVYVGRHVAPDSNFISLRNRPYLRKGEKYILDLDFTLAEQKINSGLRDNLISQGYWDNPFKFRVFITYNQNGVTTTEVLYANYGVDEAGNKYRDMNFKADERTIENSLQFVAQHEGILDIEIHPVLDESNGIKGIEIAKAELQQIGFKKTDSASRLLNDDYTVKKEVKLPFADDFTGFSKGFRLQKLRDKQDNYNSILVQGLSDSLLRDGKYFVFVPLKGANLIKENIDHVYSGGIKLEVEDVIYNWRGSEQHAIQFDTNPNLGGNISVYVYDYNIVTENRNYWEEWTDVVYKVERISYIDSVANVYNRMFDKPVKRVPDFTVKNNIKFNDFIDWDFNGPTQWMLTNCRWDIDKGYTDISVVENYYAVKVGQNIPPLVEAGDDINIGEGIEEATITCEAYDPDGYIVSYLWEEVTNNGATILSSNSQTSKVTGLRGDFYTFKITVTDNEGATASDTVNVVRQQEYQFILNQITDIQDKHTYTVSFEPRMSDAYSLNIKGNFRIESVQGNTLNTAYAAFRIRKNGVEVRNVEIGTIYGDQNEEANIVVEDVFEVNYIGDMLFEIEIEAFAEITDPESTIQASANATFTVETAEFIDGLGQVTQIPQTKTKSMLVFP